MVEQYSVFHLLLPITTSFADFKEKSKIFNSFFSKQCSTWVFTLSSGSRQVTLKFWFLDKGIKKLISKLNSNKAHDDDMTSICMS